LRETIRQLSHGVKLRFDAVRRCSNASEQTPFRDPVDLMAQFLF
jgi:hypothetical protein